MRGQGAGEQRCGGAREHLGAATVREREQGSKGAEEQGSKGAEEQGSKGAGEQGIISPLPFGSSAPLLKTLLRPECSHAQTMDRRGFFRDTLGRFGAANRNEEARETPHRAATVREREEGDPFDPGIVGKREKGQEGVENRIAVLDRSLCLAWDDQPCQLCVIRCSRSGVALYLEDFKPMVREEKCAGCGECERACALVNHEMVAIRLIPDRRSVPLE